MLGKERAALPLSASQKQKLRDWMKSKGIRSACASCGESDWGAGELISSPVLTPDGTQAADLHVPMVQLVCINCSHVMVYAAVPIGLP